MKTDQCVAVWPVFIVCMKKHCILDYPKCAQWKFWSGPVVQSIVSLMSLLVVKTLTVLVSTISNSQLFLLKKMWVAFANAKATHIFSAKILAFMLYYWHILNDQSFNDMLINDIVSFEQLGPKCSQGALVWRYNFWCCGSNKGCEIYLCVSVETRLFCVHIMISWISDIGMLAAWKQYMGPASEKVPMSFHKMCRFTSSCTCAKNHLSLYTSFIHSVVSSDSVSRQWRPWSNCMDMQADLGLCCPQMLEDMFLHVSAHIFFNDNPFTITNLPF